MRSPGTQGLRRVAANAVRLLLSAEACNLMRTYRDMLAGTELEIASAKPVR